MIATVIIEDKAPNPRPCIVRWTGSPRLLKVVIQTYCGQEAPASDFGVLQLPDKVLTKGMLCTNCMAAFRSYESSL